MNEYDNIAITGTTAIADLKDLSLMHMLQVTPSNAKKIFTCFQEAYPVRPKASHFLNSPSFFKYLYARLKLIYEQEIKGEGKLNKLKFLIYM